MEVSKHRLRISKLENEFRHISNFMIFYVGQNCKIELKGSGLPITEPSTIKLENAQTPEFKELQWRSKSIEFDVISEESKAYPDLKIGPSFQIEDKEHKVLTVLVFH